MNSDDFMGFNCFNKIDYLVQAYYDAKNCQVCPEPLLAEKHKYHPNEQAQNNVQNPLVQI